MRAPPLAARRSRRHRAASEGLRAPLHPLRPRARPYVLAHTMLGSAWAGGLPVGRHSIILGICVILAGCASSGIGQQVNLADAKQIRPGVTDKAGVERVLGIPTSRSTAPNSEEVWIYSRGGAAAAVALVSLGSQEGSGLPQEVQVYFRKNIVSRCWIRASAAAASDAPGEPATPPTTLTDCREPPKHRATPAPAPPAAAPPAQ